jgi:DNA-binding GntR family transcriptional regulator
MLIKNLEKLRKKTLRERIYEEVVRLIVSGDLPSGGWVDEKQVIEKAAGESNPVPRGARDTCKGRGLIEIKPYRVFYVRSFSRDETTDLFELYKQLEWFAVVLAAPQMSDRDIQRFENILAEAVVALQRGDMKICCARSKILRNRRQAIRQFPRLSRRWRGSRCKSSCVAQSQAGSASNAPRTDATTLYKHSRRETRRAPRFSCAPTSAICSS